MKDKENRYKFIKFIADIFNYKYTISGQYR